MQSKPKENGRGKEEITPALITQTSTHTGMDAGRVIPHTEKREEALETG